MSRQTPDQNASPHSVRTAVTVSHHEAWTLRPASSQEIDYDRQPKRHIACTQHGDSRCRTQVCGFGVHAVFLSTLRIKNLLNHHSETRNALPGINASPCGRTLFGARGRWNCLRHSHSQKLAR